MAKSMEEEIRDLGIIDKVEQVEPKKTRPVSAPKKTYNSGIKVTYDEYGKVVSSKPM